MSNEKVVIIIPTYNEALMIEETLSAVFSACEALTSYDCQVLVFDSASTDGTAAIVARLQAIYPRLHLKTEPQKSGLGAAYRQAMHYALETLNADIVFEFDADLSHQPQYLAPLLDQLKTHDVAVGSRYVRGGAIPKQWGWHRKCLSRLGNLTARLVLSPRYKDYTSGFRATRRAPLQQTLTEKLLSNHYAYKLQLFWSLHRQKARIAEYPIVFVDREKGCSKLPANSIFDTLRVLFFLRVGSF